MCQAYFTCNSFITSPRTNFPYLGSWPDACRIQFVSPAPEKEGELVGRTSGPSASFRLLPQTDGRPHLLTAAPATFRIHFNLTSATWQPLSHFTLYLLPLPAITSKHHQPF